MRRRRRKNKESGFVFVESMGRLTLTCCRRVIVGSVVSKFFFSVNERSFKTVLKIEDCTRSWFSNVFNYLLFM